MYLLPPPIILPHLHQVTYSLYVAGRPGARAGDVAAVHRLRVHAPHLGEVQQSLGPQQQT